jgi:hypothetical protein
VYKKRGEQEPEVGAPQVPYTLHRVSVADPDMVLGLLDPDPDLLVRCTDPNPFPDPDSFSSKHSKKTLIPTVL